MLAKALKLRFFLDFQSKRLSVVLCVATSSCKEDKDCRGNYNVESNFEYLGKV